MGGENYNPEEIFQMKLLIIEDEPPIADDIKTLCKSILRSKAERTDICYTLEDAQEYLARKHIDLCLLDLNLMGANGYEILKSAVARSFHTIVVSAHVEQAVEAFNYGILDFVPKPVNRERLQKALDKYFHTAESRTTATRFIAVRKQNANYLYAVEEVCYFEAEGYLVKMHLKDGKSELIEKPLTRLVQILPKRFIRAHRSCVIDVNEVTSYRHKGGGVYEVRLKSGVSLPLSRQAYKLLNSFSSK
jgi:two-component system response regulator LytT